MSEDDEEGADHRRLLAWELHGEKKSVLGAGAASSDIREKENEEAMPRQKGKEVSRGNELRRIKSHRTFISVDQNPIPGSESEGVRVNPCGLKRANQNAHCAGGRGCLQRNQESLGSHVKSYNPRPDGQKRFGRLKGIGTNKAQRVRNKFKRGHKRF